MHNKFGFSLLLKFIWLKSMFLGVPFSQAQLINSIVNCKSRVLHSQKGPVTLDEFLLEDELGKKLQPLFKKYIVIDSLPEGSRKVILSSQLSAFFRKAVEDTQISPLNYQFSLPHQIEIIGKAVTMKELEVREALLKEWKAACSQNCRVEIKELILPHFSTDDKFTGHWNFYDVPPLPRGSFSIPLQMSFENKKSNENKNSKEIVNKRYWLNGVAHVLRKVPVMQKNRGARERLVSEDIKYEYRDRTFYSDTSLLEDKQWLGRLLKWNKNSGQVLIEDDLIKEKTVMRGDGVKVVVREGGLEVTAVGRAETEGGVGDRIRIQVGSKNDPHSVLYGVIQGKGEVVLQ